MSKKPSKCFYAAAQGHMFYKLGTGHLQGFGNGILNKTIEKDYKLWCEALDDVEAKESEMVKLQYAEDAFKKALEILQRIFGAKHLSVGYTLDRLGIASFLKKNYEEAEKNFSKALKIYRSHKRKKAAADVLTNLAKIDALDQNDEALKKLDEGLEIYESLPGEHNERIAEILTVMGDIYKELGNKKKEIEFHKEALKIYERLEKEKKN